MKMVEVTNLRSGSTMYRFEKGEKFSEFNFIVPEFPVGICPECGEPLVVKSGKFGRFVGCSGFKKGCRKTYGLENFKAVFDFEVHRIPHKKRACEINYYIHKIDNSQKKIERFI